MACAVQCCAAGKAKECLPLSMCLVLEMLAAAWLQACTCKLVTPSSSCTMQLPALGEVLGTSQLRFAAAVPAAPQVSPWYVVLLMCSGQPEVQSFMAAVTCSFSCQTSLVMFAGIMSQRCALQPPANFHRLPGSSL